MNANFKFLMLNFESPALAAAARTVHSKLKIQNQKFPAVILMLGLMMSACVSGPYKADGNPDNMAATNRPRLQLLDTDLKRTLASDKPPVATRTGNGMLHVEAPLRNKTTDETLQVQVQTLFRDKNGLVLYGVPGSDVPWQTLTISPGQTVYYSQQSMTPAAADYTINVRYVAFPR
jgi:hypothetical protein